MPALAARLVLPLAMLLLTAVMLPPTALSADDAVDGSDKLDRQLKSADLKYEKTDCFFVVAVKMPPRHVQKVFVSKKPMCSATCRSSRSRPSAGRGTT